MTIKLNLERANEIRTMVKKGIGRVVIAMQYGVSVATVDKIVQGRLWLHPEAGQTPLDEHFAKPAAASAKKVMEMLSAEEDEKQPAKQKTSLRDDIHPDVMAKFEALRKPKSMTDLLVNPEGDASSGQPSMKSMGQNE